MVLNLLVIHSLTTHLSTSVNSPVDFFINLTPVNTVFCHEFHDEGLATLYRFVTIFLKVYGKNSIQVYISGVEHDAMLSNNDVISGRP